MCGSWMGELTIRSMESRVKEFFFWGGGGFIILSQTKLGTVCVCWGLIPGMLSWSCKTLQKWVLCSNKQVVSVHAAECCQWYFNISSNLCREFWWWQNHSIQMGRSERSSKWQEQNDELRCRLSCASAQVSCSWNLHIQVGLLVDLCNCLLVFVCFFSLITVC